MNTLQKIIENTAIDFWAQHFSRSPRQLNRLHQSDAELIQFPFNSESNLAATIDTVAEEIALGIYRDPYTMGWITVMASLSDLAAVGADPLGMLIAVSIQPDRDNQFVDGIARGMEDACRSQGVFILGGDTNEASALSLTGCALGLVPRQKNLSRKGCRPGDSVFITGPAGSGNALGLVRLAGYPESFFPEENYRPVAALKQGRIIRSFASCCMDTSDGVLTTLDQLMRINNLGFELDANWSRLLAPEVLELCTKTGTPEWMMAAGPHGEFELLFTVSPNRVNALQAEFEAQRFPLIQLGTVREERTLSLALQTGRTVSVDMTQLRNLYQSVNGDLNEYLTEFRSIGKQWGVE